VNTLLDISLVSGAILISAGYAVARLGPRSLRRRMRAALSRWLAAAPAFLGLGRLSKSLASAEAEGACGGCDTCGTETPPQMSSESAEIKVPLANIGRR
jgi:hypothetical protein